MRKIIARDFAVELISLIALAIAITLAWLGHALALSTPVVITASIGLSFATSIWALKWWMRGEIQDTLTIYKLLEAIEDKELYERGMIAIDECRIELENLSQGLLRIDPKHLTQKLIEISDSAKHRIRTTHVGLDKTRKGIVQPTSENQWYKHNLQLIGRGILFERVFILPRSDESINKENEIISFISEILNKQIQDGIKVYLVWEDTINPELIQEFIIIDSKLVVSGLRAWSSTAFTDVKLSRREHDIIKSIEIFDTLVSHAYPVPIVEI